jgi:hypothetical protein
MRKLLSFLIALAAIVLGVCSPASAQMPANVRAVILDPLFKKAGGGAVTGWCAAIPQSGLVNCWPFDNTYTTSSLATDPVGGNSATLSNVTLAGSGPTGSPNLNNAGVFNGTNSTGVTSLAGSS